RGLIAEKENPMPTYTVKFRTAVDYATRDFMARSPRAALKKARAFSDEREDDLIFERYDGPHRVNEIAVRNAEGREVALWQDDDLRLRLAAGDLFDALELCVDCLSELSRLDDGTPSVSALDRSRAALAKATGDTAPTTPARRLPPDPEAKNGDRAEWAAAALRHFQCITGTDYEDSLGDLLGDLMHWADRNNFDFDAALARAQGHYAAETGVGNN
ncbi:MAG TPA: hypothetical protein VME41_01055, partial [Stellaceae bacterium]|nr:hypothetical protein [Stellaceae bacterium]